MSVSSETLVPPTRSTPPGVAVNGIVSVIFASIIPHCQGNAFRQASLSADEVETIRQRLWVSNVTIVFRIVTNRDTNAQTAQYAQLAKLQNQQVSKLCIFNTG